MLVDYATCFTMKRAVDYRDKEIFTRFLSLSLLNVCNIVATRGESAIDYY